MCLCIYVCLYACMHVCIEREREYDTHASVLYKHYFKSCSP